STTTPSRRSICARFCPYGPTRADAPRLSSKSITTWVSGGICMSRSNLRLGASEGESDALLGKGSGSNGHVRRCARLLRRERGGGNLAQQAVAIEPCDADGQHASDDVFRGDHMRGLKIGGSSDDLARIASCSFEQHVHGGANRGLVKGRLLAVDQVLEPLQ